MNKYLDTTAPWFQIKTDKAAAARSIYTALRAIDSLKILFAPFLPFTSERLHTYLGYNQPLFGEQSVETREDAVAEHARPALPPREGHRPLGAQPAAARTGCCASRSPCSASSIRASSTKSAPGWARKRKEILGFPGFKRAGGCSAPARSLKTGCSSCAFFQPGRQGADQPAHDLTGILGKDLQPAVGFAPAAADQVAHPAQDQAADPVAARRRRRSPRIPSRRRPPRSAL